MFATSGYKSEFKRMYSFEDRLTESSRVLSKYDDRKPIICEKATTKDNLPELDKKKYLVPADLTIGQFIYVIRKRMNIKETEAIFLFINGRMVSSSVMIKDIYHTDHDRDGFLYLQYAKENTFG